MLAIARTCVGFDQRVFYLFRLQEATPASSAGPSKTAAKKAEKAAKKAAAKSAKSAAPAGSPPVASDAPTGAVKAATGPSLPSLYLSSDGPGPLKCLTAAKFFGVEVEAADANPAGERRKVCVRRKSGYCCVLWRLIYVTREWQCTAVLAVLLLSGHADWSSFTLLGRIDARDVPTIYFVLVRTLSRTTLP